MRRSFDTATRLFPWAVVCCLTVAALPAHGAEGLRVLDKVDRLTWTRTADALIDELPSQNRATTLAF